MKDSKEVIVLFVGGAGDAKVFFGPKKPTYIVRDQVQLPFDRIISHSNYDSKYLGYDDIYGKSRIEKNVLPLLVSKGESQIHIVGHSFGGWNAAHLSHILTEQGYSISLLITLDPVGTAMGARLTSSIYQDTPQPKCKHWINVDSQPDSWAIDDYVAWAGGQWIPSREKTEVFHESKAHHREAGKMFEDVMDGGFSASDLLLTFIQS